MYCVNENPFDCGTDSFPVTCFRMVESGAKGSPSSTIALEKWFASLARSNCGCRGMDKGMEQTKNIDKMFGMTIMKKYKCKDVEREE